MTGQKDIDCLLEGFGFRDVETGRAYLAARYRGYRVGEKISPRRLERITGDLKEAIASWKKD